MLYDHRVLSPVSRSYPRLAGSLITCYSPVRHAIRPKAFAFDLHASSTPPTFVLSQDQTLHLMFIEQHRVILFGFVANPQNTRRSAPSREQTHSHSTGGLLAPPAQDKSCADYANLKKAHTLTFEATQNVKDHALRAAFARSRGRGKVATSSTVGKPGHKVFQNFLQGPPGQHFVLLARGSRAARTGRSGASEPLDAAGSFGVPAAQVRERLA